MKLETGIFILLLITFLISFGYITGQARGIEKYTASALNESDVFANDELAGGASSGANNIISWIISKTTDTSRMVIFYLIFLFSLWVFFSLAKSVSKNTLVSLIFVLVLMYGTRNWICFNMEALSLTFDGRALAIPLVILSLKFFTDKRFYPSAVLAAAAFYLHPGFCLWYAIVLFSYLVFVFSRNFISKPKEAVKLSEVVKPALFFSGILIILILPRLYEIIVLPQDVSIIDPQLRFNLFKFTWANQTSLLFQFTRYTNKLPPLIKGISNLIFLVLIVHCFRKNQERKVRAIYYLYLSSFIFVVLNELLIHVFDCRFCVNYMLMRANGFNFLFLALLLSMMIVRSPKEGRRYESFFWFIFMVNYTVIHLYIYSGLIQLAILMIILLFRFTNIASVLDRHNFHKLLDNKGLYKAGLILFAVLIFLATGARFYLGKYNLNRWKDNCYIDAIQYVNENNKERAVVLSPFLKTEEFLVFSKNPGFFNAEYILLFIDLYHCDPAIQKKAYFKFKEIEKDLGVDILAMVENGSLAVGEAWEKAWSEGVDGYFIEKWGREYDIGYIIREKKYTSLPYEVVYENRDYKVYRRKLAS